MPRNAIVWPVLTVIMVCSEGLALAQNKFADYTLPGGGDMTLNIKNFPYGPGSYLAWWKLLPVWLLFLVWVRSLDWMNQDGQRLRLNYRRWNVIAFLSFSLAFVVVWIPTGSWVFFAGMPLLFVTYLVPFVMYVKHRNAQVIQHDKVFTRAHTRYWLSKKLKPIGIKIEAEVDDNEAP